MAIIIGSARIDERGNIANGAAGDQTGREVCTEAYYEHPLGWNVYRAKDAAVANVLAKAMEQACANERIGYDQNQRTGVISMLKKYGTLGKIAENTECDCSSLVRACCIQAGFDPGNFTTYNEGKALEATGKFEKATGLYTGDILVTKKKGHTVIVTKGAARTEPKTGLSKTPQWVGVVTAKQLNVRTWAGIENPNISKWPRLGEGNRVDVCDSVKASTGVTWYYVRIDGRKQGLGYVFGFVSSQYIRKA